MIPSYLNDIGYLMSILAMTGAMLVSFKRPVLAFILWIFTNAFELFIAAHYYHNAWMSIQFAFFEANAWIGLYMWRRNEAN
jgi:hypothetical protein